MQLSIPFFFAVAFSLLPPNLLHGDPAKLLMPFLGLFMAGIFPAISLTVNSVKSGGYSVKRIGDLSAELRRLLDYLQMLFAFALVGALTIVSAETLDWGNNFLYEFYTSRVFNIVIGFSLGALISSLPRIRSTFTILLNISTEIAQDEATTKIRDKSAKLTPVSARFPVQSDFGAVRSPPNPNEQSVTQ